MHMKQKNSKESAFYETTDKQRRECYDKLYHEILVRGILKMSSLKLFVFVGL